MLNRQCELSNEDFQLSFPEGSSGTSSTTTTENVWADNTEATVIQVKQSVKSATSPLSTTNPNTPASECVEQIENNRSSEFNVGSDTDAVADSLVDSVLEEVRSELTIYASFQISPANIESVDTNTVTAEDEAKSFVFEDENEPSISPTQFKSPQTPSEQIDEALTNIGSKFVNSQDDSKPQNHQEKHSISSNESISEEILSVESSQSSFGQVPLDTPTLSAATPETLALISSYQQVLESEDVSCIQLDVYEQIQCNLNNRSIYISALGIITDRINFFA